MAAIGWALGALFYLLGYGFTHELIKPGTSERRAWIGAAIWPLLWIVLAGSAMATALRRRLVARAERRAKKKPPKEVST